MQMDKIYPKFRKYRIAECRLWSRLRKNQM